MHYTLSYDYRSIKPEEFSNDGERCNDSLWVGKRLEGGRRHGEMQEAGTHSKVYPEF